MNTASTWRTACATGSLPPSSRSARISTLTTSRPNSRTAAGALVCLGLMLSMPAGSWWRLVLWLLTGLAVYFGYSWYAGRFRAGEVE